MEAIKYFCYNSWKEFKANFIGDLFDCDDEFINGRYLFRGQSNSEWSIVSSLDRFIENRVASIDRIAFEKCLIERFERNCQVSGNGIKTKETKKISALAQHHGLPTRLVDWTYSPYIAAFFAFSTIGLSKDIYNDNVAIYALNTEHNIWKEESGVEIILDSDEGNIHQMRQRGVFTYNKSAEKSIEDFLEYMISKNRNTDNALYKIQIPTGSKTSALLDLEAMGITHTTLFSGFESCVQSALMSTINQYF